MELERKSMKVRMEQQIQGNFEVERRMKEEKLALLMDENKSLRMQVDNLVISIFEILEGKFF
jgi:hypothetical protein